MVRPAYANITPTKPAESPSIRLAVVGIGASAGGLEAVTKLADALPPGMGMAFILVQHLDPTHKSLMVELLATHTTMEVVQAVDGMPVEPDHLYIIPPGAYLSVGKGLLHLSKLPARHGGRLPFDFLLASLADAYGARAGCVVLSGTGADGSAGVLAIRARGGLIIVQDPAEAGYDGMPRSAVQTGAADHVLPVGRIPAALTAPRVPAPAPEARPVRRRASRAMPDLDPGMADIIELLRTETSHDFTLYKPGTLTRRVERRMIMAGFRAGDMERYLERLRADRGEREMLGKDLLINVTAFFRDAKVFDRLADQVIPDLVRTHPPDQPLRIWVAGCSTGEEAYSLAILVMEQIATRAEPIKLQMFASDIDADGVAFARDGLYPATSLDHVTPDRLARFFIQEPDGWRVAPSVRSAIVFTVQDVLTDPPFSRLDLVSCRNLLIYLNAEAQANAIDRFYFALRDGGILLLGTAEAVPNPDTRFAPLVKAARIYRRIGRNGPAPKGMASAERAVFDTTPPATVPAGNRSAAIPGAAYAVASGAGPTAASGRAQARPAALAELGRRLVIDAYAPASVLVNAANETMFLLGPAERYLRAAPGHATLDLLAMARPGLRAKLRPAMDEARETRTLVSVPGRLGGGAGGWSYTLEVHPVLDAGEEMLLVCFVDRPPEAPRAAGVSARPGSPVNLPRVAELERELEATRTELQGTVRDLELSGEEQRSINEEALSVNEEYQSTNEELVASKEELQALNEELTVLNGQLQESLERQRVAGDDLQNVLYSTNVATLFLDADLRIRFFTPAIRSLFDLVQADIGRKLSAFAALAPDASLEADARAVLVRLDPVEREIEAQGAVWFRRRILPYRTQAGRVEGVVITFTDITARKAVDNALEAATKVAETANAAKSRFLAAASHDLRQPLQTLALVQALLDKAVDGAKAAALVRRMDDTLGAMAGMLDTMLDINEIEAGVITPEFGPFALDDVFGALRDEFVYHAQANRLELRVVLCGLQVRSDRRLLERMLRNLVSNAIKYTATGRILLGCRRCGGVARLEVWDTGIGIEDKNLTAIFEEYRQVGNAARQRSHGLGLGLSIVQQLGAMLHHPIGVRSCRGRGSVFTIEVPMVDAAAPLRAIIGEAGAREAGAREEGAAGRRVARTGAGQTIAVLVVEDDPDVREMLGEWLRGEGHRVMLAADGPAAMACLAQQTPGLIIADFALPNGPNGLDLALAIRGLVSPGLPMIVLTGDIVQIAHGRQGRDGAAPLHYAQLTKPVRLPELEQTIARLLQAAPLPPAVHAANSPDVYVVDDDDAVRTALADILEESGRTVMGYATAEAFLAGLHPGAEACLLVDAYLPGITGIDLIERLHAAGRHLPAIMITGQSDVAIAVRAMKAGASDFIAKPVGRDDLLASIARALEQSRDSTARDAWQADAVRHLAGLTSRQREVMTMVLAGHPSKNIAADLGISQRTVENHRASIMRKTGAHSLPALARLALAAAPADAVD